MNFTTAIKKEITRKKPTKKCCKKALLSGFLRAVGKIFPEEKQFLIAIQSDVTAEYVYSLIESVYGVALVPFGHETDKLTERENLWFACEGDEAMEILRDLSLLRYENNRYIYEPKPILEDKKIGKNACCRVAYLKGLFLGAGSATIPAEYGTNTSAKTGYHWEIALSDPMVADDLCELLGCEEDQFYIIASQTLRKSSYVVYVKSQQSISDLLAIMGLEESLGLLNKRAEEREEENRNNRIKNIQKGNKERASASSRAQIEAIEAIRRTVGFSSFDEDLKKTAIARIEYPDDSLAELAARLGISKGGLSHRIRKLTEIAKNLTE